MTKNVGLIDKTIRIAAGIGLIVATIGGTSCLGLDWYSSNCNWSHEFLPTVLSNRH